MVKKKSTHRKFGAHVSTIFRKISKQLNSFCHIKYFRKQDEKMLLLIALFSVALFTPNWYD